MMRATLRGGIVGASAVFAPLCACPGWWSPTGHGDVGASATVGETTNITTSEPTTGEPTTGEESAGRPDFAARRPCTGDPALWVGADCEGNQPCHITIQGAVNAADDGATIWVYPGTYTNKKGGVLVDLGDKQLCLRSVAGPETTILSGLGDDGGVLVRGSRPWVEGFLFYDLWVGDQWDPRDGFCMQILGGTDLRAGVVGNGFVDCLRGAVLVEADDLDFSADVYIASNTIIGNGAGILLDLAGPRAESGTIRIENNLLVDNSVALFAYPFLDLGGGRGTLRFEIINNTMHRNGGGLELALDGLFFHNNIVSQTFPDNDAVGFDDPTSKSVRSNLFHAAPQFAGINGNLVATPSFLDGDPFDPFWAAGDYRLTLDSPGQGDAVPDLAPEYDHNGVKRRPAPDRGAFESKPLEPPGDTHDPGTDDEPVSGDAWCAQLDPDQVYLYGSLSESFVEPTYVDDRAIQRPGQTGSACVAFGSPTPQLALAPDGRVLRVEIDGYLNRMYEYTPDDMIGGYPGYLDFDRNDRELGKSCPDDTSWALVTRPDGGLYFVCRAGANDYSYHDLDGTRRVTLHGEEAMAVGHTGDLLATARPVRLASSLRIVVDDDNAAAVAVPGGAENGLVRAARSFGDGFRIAVQAEANGPLELWVVAADSSVTVAGSYALTEHGPPGDDDSARLDGDGALVYFRDGRNLVVRSPLAPAAAAVIHDGTGAPPVVHGGALFTGP